MTLPRCPRSWHRTFTPTRWCTRPASWQSPLWGQPVFCGGTDAPFAATQDRYEHLTDYLTKGDAFTSEELADVYYNNAKRVYFDN